MPYISAENVKVKRIQIKKEFPNFKFSITKQHNSEIYVIIKEAPFDMIVSHPTCGHDQVNHFYIREHYKDYPIIMNVLLRIKAILIEGQKELVYDADYGSVPNFYISINVGAFDKPFKIVKKHWQNR